MTKVTYKRRLFWLITPEGEESITVGSMAARAGTAATAGSWEFWSSTRKQRELESTRGFPDQSYTSQNLPQQHSQLETKNSNARDYLG